MGAGGGGSPTTRTRTRPKKLGRMAGWLTLCHSAFSRAAWKFFLLWQGCTWRHQYCALIAEWLAQASPLSATATAPVSSQNYDYIATERPEKWPSCRSGSTMSPTEIQTSTVHVRSRPRKEAKKKQNIFKKLKKKAKPQKGIVCEYCIQSESWAAQTGRKARCPAIQLTSVIWGQWGRSGAHPWNGSRVRGGSS